MTVDQDPWTFSANGVDPYDLADRLRTKIAEGNTDEKTAQILFGGEMALKGLKNSKFLRAGAGQLAGGILNKFNGFTQAENSLTGPGGVQMINIKPTVNNPNIQDATLNAGEDAEGVASSTAADLSKTAKSGVSTAAKALEDVTAKGAAIKDTAETFGKRIATTMFGKLGETGLATVIPVVGEIADVGMGVAAAVEGIKGVKEVADENSQYESAQKQAQETAQKNYQTHLQLEQSQESNQRAKQMTGETGSGWNKPLYV